MGTILTLLVVLLLLGSISTTYVPAQLKDMEYVHMEGVQATFAELQDNLDGDWADLGPGKSGRVRKSVPLALGSPGIPAFAHPTQGLLEVDTTDAASLVLSYEFVTSYDNGTVAKVDQDVVLILDSSGSMQWNDPDDVRLEGARDYISTLSAPDRVAIVDFDSRARLVRTNVREEPHHLFHPGHTGEPDYQEAIDDLETIDSWGGTNYGWALWMANNELIVNGDPNHTWVEILLTDGWNNYWWYSWWAQWEAVRARDNGIVLYTIGLGNHDVRLLRWMAEYTGGRYYAAPSPEALRWIYYDISQNFQGGVQCACTEVAERGGGRVSLEVRNRHYVPQTVLYENGAVVTTQSDGSLMSSPPDLTVGRGTDGGLHLGLGLTSLVGASQKRQGHGTEILRLKPIASTTEAVALTRIDLADVRDSLDDLREELDHWHREGAATHASVATLESAVLRIDGWLDTAETALSMDELERAMDAVQVAMDETDAAVFTTAMEAAGGGLQGWLADSVVNDLSRVKCRLSQWMKWANGVTLRITTGHPALWGSWLEATFQSAGVRYAMTYVDGGLSVRLFAVDVIDLRMTVVEISL